jgi:hypothetical protein
MLFQDETLLLSVSLFDRVTSLKRLVRRELQLYGATCLWIASKIEERLTPMLSDFIYLCAGIYTAADFIECETQILTLLHFAVASTTSIVYVQAAVEDGTRIGELARFFCLVLMCHPSYGTMSASVMGTTAVILACFVCGERVSVAKQSVDEVVGCAQQVIIGLQEVEGNPIRRALPRWLAGKGIGDLKEQVTLFTKTAAIHTFESDD